MSMNDDELLADADKRVPVIRSLCGEGTADLVAKLAAALRAALVARPQPEIRVVRLPPPEDDEELTTKIQAVLDGGDDSEWTAHGVMMCLRANRELVTAAVMAGLMTPEEDNDDG